MTAVDIAFERLRRANPVPDPLALRAAEADPDVFLAATQQRSRDMDTELETISSPTPSRPPRRPWVPALAAFATIVVAAGFALFFAADSEPDDAASTDPRAAALALVDDFLAAYNAGDDVAAVAMLTSDVAASDTWGSMDIAAELAWFTSQEARLDGISCSAAEDLTVEGIVVTCQYEFRDAVTVSVDARPVPTTTEFVVVPEGISAVHFGYGSPDFTHAGFPFRDWLADTRPDVTCLAWYAEGADCTEPQTLEQERAEGRRVAEVAAEWAAYLEERGCTYLDDC